MENGYYLLLINIGYCIRMWIWFTVELGKLKVWRFLRKQRLVLYNRACRYYTFVMSDEVIHFVCTIRQFLSDKTSSNAWRTWKAWSH